MILGGIHGGGPWEISPWRTPWEGSLADTCGRSLGGGGGGSLGEIPGEISGGGSLGVSLREIPGGDPHGGIPGASSERIPVGIPGAIPGVISGRGSLGEPWGNPPWRVSEGDPWEGIRGGSLCWGIAGGIPGGGPWDRG